MCTLNIKIKRSISNISFHDCLRRSSSYEWIEFTVFDESMGIKFCPFFANCICQIGNFAINCISYILIFLYPLNMMLLFKYCIIVPDETGRFWKYFFRRGNGMIISSRLHFFHPHMKYSRNPFSLNAWYMFPNSKSRSFFIRRRFQDSTSPFILI